MLRHIIDVRLRFDQLLPLRAIDSNRERVRFSRAMNGRTRQKLSAHLQRGSTVNRALLDPWQPKCYLPDHIEIHCRSGHTMRCRLAPAENIRATRAALDPQPDS